MSSKSTTILYIYTARRSFVNNDLLMLEKHFKVVPYHFRTDVKWMTPLSFVKQLLYLLFLGWKYDTLISFFAGYHSVLPCLFARLFGKKGIIILGGTDCFKYPSFRYGNFTKPAYGKATCISVSSASLLLPVSQNLIRSDSKYYTVDSTEQGIQVWCSNMNTPYQVVPLEYDPSLFKRTSTERIPNSFITVAFGIQGTSFIRKGIDKFIMAAAHFPNSRFTIVGSGKENFPVEVPKNVVLIPPVPYSALVDLYNQHEFYLQLSIAEGFPSAPCEAMLCECFPIASAVASMPEIIGDTGLLISSIEDKVIIAGIQKALQTDNKGEIGKQARERIIAKFGPGSRKNKLMEVLKA
jgi:glycosyltransferase involved in cell wall biosynthesis